MEYNQQIKVELVKVLLGKLIIKKKMQILFSIILKNLIYGRVYLIQIKINL